MTTITVDLDDISINVGGDILDITTDGASTMHLIINSDASDKALAVVAQLLNLGLDVHIGLDEAPAVNGDAPAPIHPIVYEVDQAWKQQRYMERWDIAAEAWQVECPKCGAARDERCTRSNGKSYGVFVHGDRVVAANKARVK